MSGALPLVAQVAVEFGQVAVAGGHVEQAVRPSLRLKGGHLARHGCEGDPVTATDSAPSPDTLGNIAAYGPSFCLSAHAGPLCT